MFDINIALRITMLNCKNLLQNVLDRNIQLRFLHVKRKNCYLSPELDDRECYSMSELFSSVIQAVEVYVRCLIK